MGKLYDTDIVAWAEQQAAFLRRGEWSRLDIANLAEEIEDVGKSEQRELHSRMAVLLSHLLKWQFQPDLRGKSWRSTIALQRRLIARRVRKTPSLKHLLVDEQWLEDVWEEAATFAIGETGIDEFPEDPIWTVDNILDPAFFPD
ncbi:MAG: DUF29 domain-containing protein [Telluria sp.]